MEVDRAPSPAFSTTSSNSSIYIDVFDDIPSPPHIETGGEQLEDQSISPASSYATDDHSHYLSSPGSLAVGIGTLAPSEVTRQQIPQPVLAYQTYEIEEVEPTVPGDGSPELERASENATLNSSPTSPSSPGMDASPVPPTVFPSGPRRRFSAISFRRTPTQSPALSRNVSALSLSSLLSRSRPSTPETPVIPVHGVERRRRKFSLPGFVVVGSSNSRVDRGAPGSAISGASSPLSTSTTSFAGLPGSTTPKLISKRGRSLSAPLLSSSLVSATPPSASSSSAISIKLEEVKSRDLIDSLLPREIMVRVFSTLQRLTREDFPEDTKRGNELGQRNLVRLGLVSKYWHSLSLDGQLWASVSADAARNSAFLLRLFQNSGTFVRALNLNGCVSIGKKEGDNMDDSSVGVQGDEILGLITRVARLSGGGLRDVDLSGCRNTPSPGITVLLNSSPFLSVLSLSSHPSLTALSLLPLESLQALTTLDISRCSSLLAPAVIPLLPTSLAHLNISTLPLLTDVLVSTLLRRCFRLSTLNLSYNSLLTDVSFSTLLHSRIELNLRHLSLSGCPQISDETARSLITLAPKLEIVELARIGAGLRNAGLIQLFEKRMNQLRRIDLEDAVGLDDTVLRALVPKNKRGSALERLIISSVPTFSDAAIRALIVGCQNLAWLEADSTGIFDSTCKLFVRLVEERGKHAAESNTKLLSVLDNRGIGRRIYGDGHTNLTVAGAVGARTRMGRMSNWAEWLGYHSSSEQEGINEVDGYRVAVRSFVGALRVDHADERKRNLLEQGLTTTGSRDHWRAGLLEMRRRREGDDATRSMCIVS